MEYLKTFEAVLRSLTDRDDLTFVLANDKNVQGRINTVEKDFVSVLDETSHLVIFIPFHAIMSVQISTEPPSA
jgi:hypothetical protein